MEFLTVSQLEQAFEIAIFKTQRKYFCSNLRVMTVLNARTGQREYFHTNNQIVFSVGGPVYECWLPYKYQSSVESLIDYLKKLLGLYIVKFTKEQRLALNNRFINNIGKDYYQWEG